LKRAGRGALGDETMRAATPGGPAGFCCADGRAVVDGTMRMTKVSMAAGIVAVLLALSGPAIGQQGALQTSMVGPSHSDSTQMSYARHLARPDQRLSEAARTRSARAGRRPLGDCHGAHGPDGGAAAAEPRRLPQPLRKHEGADLRRECRLELPVSEAQLEGWRASPGHHRNLLEPKVARMGVAASRSYVTFSPAADRRARKTSGRSTGRCRFAAAALAVSGAPRQFGRQRFARAGGRAAVGASIESSRLPPRSPP